MAPLATLVDREGDRATAWVVTPDGTSAERRELALGHVERDGYLEVTSGLLAGEPLILPPHDGLRDGRRIRVSETSP